MSTYWELLKDPRWQRKRLEVLERDGWACRQCKDTTTTLNVHHVYYERGRKPWEYENEALVSLCEPCHERLTGQLADLHKLIGCLASEGVEHMIGFLRAGVYHGDRQATGGISLRSRFEVRGAMQYLGMSNVLADAIERIERDSGVLTDASIVELNALSNEKKRQFYLRQSQEELGG